MFEFKNTGKFLVKDIDTSKNIVKGYGAAFGNVDEGGDVIYKGCFAKSIAENGPKGKDRIKYLAQHALTEEPIGKMLELYEDDFGVVFVAKMADTVKGRDYMELIKSGIVNENSVGFTKVQYDQNDTGGRDIKEGMLWEISAVNIAMNEKAVITDAKGAFQMDKVKDTIERYDKLAKLFRKGKISEEFGYRLEAELLQLKSIFEQVTQPTKEITEPTPEEIKATQEQLFINEIAKHLS